MDRAAWLKEQRRISEEQEDRIYAPIYDEQWGAIDPLHERFFKQFLELCPPGGQILDAACGTGKYWPVILDRGRRVYGIDQSQGMLRRAQEKHPQVPVEKLGLQEMRYQEAFDGAVCMDALELSPPEDWPLILENLQRAVKPESYVYFTVETAAQADLEKAYDEGRRRGLPLVQGEWAEESGYHGVWAQEGFYHYYPSIEQVKAWVQQAGLRLVEEAAGEEYHHFLIQKGLRP